LEKHFKILKTKHSFPSPFVVHPNHSIYIVFLDPHQGIDSFAFFLPTSKGLCGAQVGINLRTYLDCIYYKAKIRIQGKNVILLDQDVHVRGCIMVANYWYLLMHTKFIRKRTDRIPM
jgi:hypothetical protein